MNIDQAIGKPIPVDDDLIEHLRGVWNDKNRSLPPYYQFSIQLALSERFGFKPTDFNECIMVVGEGPNPEGRVNEMSEGMLWHLGPGFVFFEGAQHAYPQFTSGLVVPGKNNCFYEVKTLGVQHADYVHKGSSEFRTPYHAERPEFADFPATLYWDVPGGMGGDQGRCAFRTHRWEFMRAWLDKKLGLGA